MAGADDNARLTIALVRLEQHNYEGALNLTNKLLEERPWALDGQLAKAEALHGLGREDEALAALKAELLKDGWPELHEGMALEQVILRQRGTTWPKEVALRAEALAIAISVAKGDQAGAQALYDQAVKVSGENERLKAALQPAPAPAPPAPAPAPAPK
jgi:tetratricopeptide (TPR) repeat protein